MKNPHPTVKEDIHEILSDEELDTLLRLFTSEDPVQGAYLVPQGNDTPDLQLASLNDSTNKSLK